MVGAPLPASHLQPWAPASRAAMGCVPSGCTSARGRSSRPARRSWSMRERWLWVHKGQIVSMAGGLHSLHCRKLGSLWVASLRSEARDALEVLPPDEVDDGEEDWASLQALYSGLGAQERRRVSLAAVVTVARGTSRRQTCAPTGRWPPRVQARIMISKSTYLCRRGDAPWVASGYSLRHTTGKLP